MEEQAKNVNDLLKQIEHFENTIRNLEQNVTKLKEKLSENKQKYGDDIAKWPKQLALKTQLVIRSKGKQIVARNPYYDLMLSVCYYDNFLVVSSSRFSHK